MKIVFVIIGYETKTDQGQLTDSVQFEVYAKNTDEAIKKAKDYIKKSFYLVRQVIEKDDKS